MNSLADRIFTGEIFPGEVFIDHNNGGRLLVIIGSEKTASV
jgi:hypothetical protein